MSSDSSQMIQWNFIIKPKTSNKKIPKNSTHIPEKFQANWQKFSLKFLINSPKMYKNIPQNSVTMMENYQIILRPPHQKKNPKNIQIYFLYFHKMPHISKLNPFKNSQ